MHKSPTMGQFKSLVCSCVLLASALGQNQPPSAAPATPGHSGDASVSPASQAFDLSDEITRDVLTNFQRGIETHNLDKVLDVFDPDGMKDYAQFRDQMTAFFRLHDSIKFRYQLLQATADKDQGSAVVDVDMEAESIDILPTTQRHSTQMRFQLKRGAKGWKVTGLQPQNFFE